jgi:hypothetical protein
VAATNIRKNKGDRHLNIDLDKINLDKKNLRLFVLIFFVGGAIALGAGSLLAVRAVKFERRASRAVGIVMDNVVTIDNAENQVSYHPKIKFRTKEGLDVTIISPNGNSDAEFRVGEEVPVLYDPQKPTDATIDSFWHRWMLAIIFLGLGAVAVIVAFVVRTSRRSSKEAGGLAPQVS